MRVFFKENGDIVLQFEDRSLLKFDTVSSCVNYCREHDLDPVVGDCKFIK